VISFRFPLQKVLDWRRTELDLAEARFRQEVEALANLDRLRAQMEAAENAAEQQVRSWNPVAAGELEALGSFRVHMKSRLAGLEKPRGECLARLAERRQQMLEARRRLRLLERLKQRRLAEWTVARDHELEEVASESYLAQWNRHKSRIGSGA